MKMTFKCPNCEAKKSVYSNTTETIVCDCGSNMSRVYTIASDQSSTAKERRCEIFNVNLLNDHEKVLKWRSDEHYWTVLVPEFVASGKYPIREMLDNGWIYYDDKGNIVTQTKPPHRR